MSSSLTQSFPGADWFAIEGRPFPLGATLLSEAQAYNFAIASNSATSVTLVLFTNSDLVNPVYKQVLDPKVHKSGTVWHTLVNIADTKEALYYAYLMDGDSSPGSGGRFDSEKILLDPYAKVVYFPPNFSRQAAQQPGSTAGTSPLGVLPTDLTPFDWGDDNRPSHTSDTIIYEMHVKGFTNNPNSDVNIYKRGTFLGVIDKIPHLVDLGVTVVELMPIYLFDPEDGGDYWGYMPLSYFSPHRGYSNAANPADFINEVKQLVKAFHDANIEVVLDVVYNHTTEVGSGGPTYAYRGIDNAGYYLLTSDRNGYIDVTGCGNSVASNQPIVRRMIVDSLRYWLTECHVDGFRFDLGGEFIRNPDGSIDTTQPPIIGEITSDPVLAGARLIAEPYDVGSFELGRMFPGSTWYQWNTDYRDTLRKFVRGDNGIISTLMTRLYGSEFDFFPDDTPNACHPYQSVNYIDCHDGFTLYDIVAYNQKHNEANLPGQEGGTDQNFSDNCGNEGDVGASATTLALRRQRIKGFFTMLMMSNGTPMFVMGDEFMRTQGGNNNPFNQDNPTSWVDWDLLKLNADVYRFFKNMIAFRKNHPGIGRSRFWGNDITWYGVQGSPDQGFTSHTLAFCLQDPQGFGAQDGPSGGKAGPGFYVMLNFYSQDLQFDIQQGLVGSWKRVVDTSLASPSDIADPGNEVVVQASTYLVKTQSVVVLVSGDPALSPSSAS